MTASSGQRWKDEDLCPAGKFHIRPNKRRFGRGAGSSRSATGRGSYGCINARFAQGGIRPAMSRGRGEEMAPDGYPNTVSNSDNWGCSVWYIQPSEPPAIDVSIFEGWHDKSLRYLWRNIQPVLRKFKWLVRRSEPRWRAERWKAKT